VDAGKNTAAGLIPGRTKLRNPETEERGSRKGSCWDWSGALASKGRHERIAVSHPRTQQTKNSKKRVKGGKLIKEEVEQVGVALSSSTSGQKKKLQEVAA